MSRRSLALLAPALASVPLLAPPAGAQLTSADTLVLDVAPGATGSKPYPLGALGDRLIFKTHDAGAAQTLWISDGTPAGTAKLKTFPSATLGIPDLVCDIGDEAVFVADERLYRTDGTLFGTFEYLDLDSLGFTVAYVLWSAPLGDTGRCVFAVRENLSGYHLVVTDGTAAGTADFVQVGDTQHPEAFGDRIVFAGRPASGGPFEPWITDGTAAGTHAITDVPPVGDDSKPSELTTANGLVFFEANDVELWRTDGTAAGTQLVKALPGVPSNLVAFGDGVVFVTQSDLGRELWVSDGSAAGTIQVTSFASGPFLGAFPSDSRIAGSYAYFWVHSDLSSPELWRTDGTPGGTIHVADRYYSDGAPTDDGKLVFVSSEGGGDFELFLADGAPGKTLLADIAPGFIGSYPKWLRRVGANVFFNANDQALGEELHAVTVAEAGGWIASPYGTGCGSADPPRMTTSLTPTLGDPFGVGVQGTPGAPTWLFLAGDPGFQHLGGSCAVLLQAPLLAGAFVTDGVGAGGIVAPLPAAPALAGLPLYFQAVLATGAGPFGGADVTNALEVVLGL
jgi:ELWxxDGT repeat protein